MPRLSNNHLALRMSNRAAKHAGTLVALPVTNATKGITGDLSRQGRSRCDRTAAAGISSSHETAIDRTKTENHRLADLNEVDCLGARADAQVGCYSAYCILSQRPSR